MAYQFIYDKKTSPIIFSMEDITAFVDSNRDAKVTPAESILLDSLRKDLELAKKDKKRMFISIGHLSPDQWIKFKSWDDLILYCKWFHGFQNTHVEKSFYNIKEPTYCWEGFGAYFEIDGERNLKALWIYRNSRFAVFCNHSIQRLLKYFISYDAYMNLAGYFIDKNFIWQRIPSIVLDEKLNKGKDSKLKTSKGDDYATTPTIFLPWNFADRFDRFKELKSLKRHAWDLLSDIQRELDKEYIPEAEKMALKQIVSDMSQAKTPIHLHSVIMKHLDKIKKSPCEIEKLRFDVKNLFTAIYGEMINTEKDNAKPSYMEDALFYYAVMKSGEKENAAEIIETLDRLERDFPHTHYLSSSFLYKADAYAFLAEDAYCGNPQYNIHLEAAIQYYLKAFEYIDKAIEHLSKKGDAVLDGFHYQSGNILTDRLINGSSLKAAILMRSRIASQIQDSKIKTAGILDDYLNGLIGPDLVIENQIR
ncbi:hypothetical protein JW926_18575 [Candidatus Sumerlaeota bacterium]|nr:hypothetical protein [Candidatus Sumerlaeota bacterium]